MPKKNPPLPPKEGWNAPPGGSRAPREEWEPQKPKDKPGDMFPIAGQAREEWEPQQNPGIVPNIGNPRSTDEPDIVEPDEADTRTTKLRKGGAVKKYAGGGSADDDGPFWNEMRQGMRPGPPPSKESLAVARKPTPIPPAPPPGAVGNVLTSKGSGVGGGADNNPAPIPGWVKDVEPTGQKKGGSVQKSGWRKYGW